MGQAKTAPITAKQIKIVKMACRDMGLEDAAYRDMLQAQFGVDSCTRLTCDQANALIDDLQKKGFDFRPVKAGRQARPPRKSQSRPAGTPRQKGNMVALASPQEIEKINAVAALIPWRFEDGLQRFLAARVGLRDGRVRTAGDAYKAIESLKKMFENGMKQLHGWNFWTIRFEDPAIEDYIGRHAPAEYRDVLGNVIKRGQQ